MTDRITAFGPVAGTDARVLILGSMPSIASLEAGFYYGHPRNAFWRILAEIYGGPPPETVPEKTALLEEHCIALWDVLASCERAGSLDSAIRKPEANDFSGLFGRCPGIRGILFNGVTAQGLFMKHCATFLTGREWARLPSTSPAYTLSYERKLAQWRQALMKYESV